MTDTPKADAADTATQAAKNIEALLRPVEAICRGEKPTEYPPELFDLLNRMWHDGFLAEAPASYVYLPGEDTENAELRRNKGQTWVHPVSRELVIRKQTIDSAATDDGVFNYKVLGLDPHFRLLSRTGGFDTSDPVEQCEDARALILTRGDMHCLRQALHILYAKLTNDGRARETALIIQNTQNDFWNPMLKAVGLESEKCFLKDRGVYITNYPGGNETVDEGRTSTLHVLKSLPDMHNPPKRDRMDATIQPGDRMYVASGSPHKSKEIAAAFTTMRARVNVYSLNSAIDVKPQEAEEASCSLEGNNMEKLQSVLERVRNDIGYDNLCRALCDKGGRPDKTWLMFDDRGLEFMDPRIMQTRAFDPVRTLLNPYTLKPGPGAELAWILKTISRTRLFEEMLFNAVKEIQDRGDETPVDMTVLDTACHITVRLDWLEDQNPRYLATLAKVHSLARTYPAPLNDKNGKPIKSFQTDHYLVPLAFDRGLPLEEQRTKAEIENYIEAHSEVAGSIRALGQLTDIAAHNQNLSEFNLEFSAAGGGGQRYRLASLHTLFHDVFGHGPRKLKRVITHPFDMMAGNKMYSMSEFRNSKPMRAPARASDNHREKAETVLNRIRALYQDADGFILTEDNPTKLTGFPGLKWLKTLFYFSLVVGKQVDDRAIKSKFFGQIKGDDSNSWADQDNMFQHLAKTPLLLNRQEDIMAEPMPGTVLRRALRKFKTDYIRPTITDKGIVEKDDRIPMPSDLYRVTVYCSASLGKETAACNNAFQFAYSLANNGFALINGGGKEGLMVATSEGVHAARRDWSAKHKRPMPRNHVTSYQCHDTFEREGGWHKDNDDARIFQVIEQRMAHLMNTDAEILMAGGAGSIQEIAASLLMRQWGVFPVENRPLIIVNEQIDGVRVFDALLGMMTNQEMIDLNVHIVESQERAMDLLMKSRTDMQATADGKKIYIPKKRVHTVANRQQPYRAPAARMA